MRPKPATCAGLICCLLEVEHWGLETTSGKSVFILHIMDASTWCQAGISAQVLQPLWTRATCPAWPKVTLWELQWINIDSKMFWEGSLAGDALQCSGGGWLWWYSDKITFFSFECDRELLSLGVQRLAFHFPLPSAALGSSWNIPGDQLSAPVHPCLLG